MANELLNPQTHLGELVEGKLREVPSEWTPSRPQTVPTLWETAKDPKSQLNERRLDATARNVLFDEYKDALLTTGFVLLAFAGAAAFIAYLL